MTPDPYGVTCDLGRGDGGTGDGVTGEAASGDAGTLVESFKDFYRQADIGQGVERVFGCHETRKDVLQHLSLSPSPSLSLPP